MVSVLEQLSGLTEDRCINPKLKTTLAASIHNGGSEGEQWH